MFLVLRKCISAKELQTRVVALKGYLALLRQATEKDQIEEILGMLRRFLSQPDLKEILYTELKELAEGDPESAAILFDFLNVHFAKYVEDDKILLDECFRDGKVLGNISPLIYAVHLWAEPIHLLISSICSCLFQLKRDEAIQDKLEVRDPLFLLEDVLNCSRS